MSKRGKEMLRKAQACNEANTGFPKIALFMLNRAIEYRQLVGETYKHFPMYDKVDKASEDTHDQEIKDLTKVRAKLAEGEQRHPLRQNEQLAFEDAKIKAEVSKKVANARTELIDLLKINEVVAKKRSKLSDDKPHVPSTGKQVADSTGCLLKTSKAHKRSRADDDVNDQNEFVNTAPLKRQRSGGEYGQDQDI